jgi:hypothetical protein
MNQHYPLDRIIKQISEPTKNLSSGQKIVTIDKKTAKAMQGKSFFSIGNLLKDTEYYLISSNTQAEHSFTYNDKVFGAGSFSLVIEYQVSIEMKNAEKVAEVLCIENHPGIVLEQNIEKCLRDYIRRNSESFSSDFPQGIKDIKRFVIEKIQSELSLIIDVQISLDASKLEPYLVESQHILVLVKDCNEELDLKIKAELIVDPKNKVKAISNYERRKSLSAIVKEEIKNYLLKDIFLQEFYYKLKTTVCQKLKIHLDSVLVSYGFQLKLLQLDTSSLIPQEFFEVEYDIKCQLQDYYEPIMVRNRLQLKSCDVSLFKIASSPPLLKWSQEQLTVITRQVLFQKKYEDILYHFEIIADSIKNQIQRKALNIGYQVDHIISTAELKEKELTKEFSLEQDESIFTIKDAKVKVKLNIIVRAKIEKLENIRGLLNSGIGVDEFKAFMRDAINDTIREFLDTVEPERYYLRFDTKDRNHSQEERTIAEELKFRVFNRLNKDFHATVVSVVIKYLDTEVSIRYENLYRESCQFEMEIESWKDSSEAVKFRGDLQIVGVDENSWSIFQSRDADLEKIKSYFLRSVTPKLKTFASSTLTIEEASELANIQAFIDRCANEALTEQYGLLVNIRNCDRDRTKRERDLAELEEVKNNAVLMAETDKINKIVSNLKLIEAQDNYRKDLVAKKIKADLGRYDKLRELQEELEIPDEKDIEEELQTFNNVTHNIEEQEITTIIEEVIPKQVKRVKFGQDLINTETFSSFHGHKYLEITQSNDEDTK